MEYEDVKQRLEGLTLQDLDGKSLSVASLWAKRRVLLAFLRHFG